MLQHLLAAFCAALLSFGHADASRHADMIAAATPHFTPSMAAIPSREEIEQAHLRAASYAGSACLSCRRTNVSYSAR